MLRKNGQNAITADQHLHLFSKSAITDDQHLHLFSNTVLFDNLGFISC